MGKIVVLFVLGLLPVLAACGAGNGGPSTSIHVTLTDFEFSPNAFTVPAGAQISFTAVNNGAGEHSFVIMKLSYEVKDHFRTRTTQMFTGRSLVFSRAKP